MHLVGLLYGLLIGNKMDSQTIVSVTKVLNKQSTPKFAQVVYENQHCKRNESEVVQ